MRNLRLRMVNWFAQGCPASEQQTKQKAKQTLHWLPISEQRPEILSMSLNDSVIWLVPCPEHISLIVSYTFPVVCFAPTTHVRDTPVTGHLHLLFPLRGMLFLFSISPSFTALRFLLNRHLLSEASPTTLFQLQTSPLPHAYLALFIALPASFCSISLISIWYNFSMYILLTFYCLT